MNERFRLNSELVRDALEKEGRKYTWLARQLSVSSSTVDKMLYDGHVPKMRTLSRLAVVLGCLERDLLMPKEASKRTA